MIKINDQCYHFRDHLRNEVKNVKRFGNAVTLQDFLQRALTRYVPIYEAEREENSISFYFLFIFVKKFSNQNKEEKHLQYNAAAISGKIESAFADALKQTNKVFFSKKQQSLF